MTAAPCLTYNVGICLQYGVGCSTIGRNFYHDSISRVNTAGGLVVEAQHRCDGC